MSKITAIVLAAGSGSRMHSETKKQYMEINGKPVVWYSLNAFENSKVDEILLVVPEGEREYAQAEFVDKYGPFKNVFFVVTSADNFYVDAWQFADAQHDAINEVEGSKAINRQSYDLSGRKLSESDNHRGIIIEQYTDENGVQHSRKIIPGKKQ